MSVLALVGGRIALPDRIVEGKALLIEDGCIEGLAGDSELGPGIEHLDVGGRLIAPGLVDMHTHGALGRAFDECDTRAWELITDENARRGVTSILATLVATPLPDLLASLDFARHWMGSKHGGSQVLGVHLESPYISPAQCGALDPASLRLPGDGSPLSILQYSDILKVWVLAPELPGALDLVETLARAGILVAAGHSAAQDGVVAAAMKRGLSHVTHIWSAMSSVIREGPWRKPGLLEAALTFDGLSVEMIADNRHLPPTLMKLAYKCLGPDRLCAVSDAGSGAGLAEGESYALGALTFEVRDGVGQSQDRKVFGGSSTLLNQMIPVLTEVVGISLPEALRMVSLTPARAIGLEGRKGSIEKGKDADLAIFNDDFFPWRTMIRGQWI